MSNVKSFNVNGTSAPINIVNDTEDGFMSSHDYIKLVDMSTGINLNTSSDGEIIYPNEVIAITDCPEFIDVKTDYDGKLLESIDVDGYKSFYMDVNIAGELTGTTIDVLNNSILDVSVNINNVVNDTSIIFATQTFEIYDNSEWLNVTTDSSGKILEGLRTDGTKYINDIDSPCVSNVKENILNVSSNIRSAKNELNFFNIAIDPSMGILRICGKTYKLISYEGDALFDEYVDVSAYINSITTTDNPEFLSVIVDAEDKILYGVYADSIETDIDLYGTIVTNPYTGSTVTLNSVINSIIQ